MRLKFKHIFIILFILATRNSNGNITIDSLKKRISLETNQASKTMLFLRLSEDFGYNNLDSMLRYAELANDLAIKTNFIKGEFLSSIKIASACYVTGEYGKGLIKAKRALVLAQKTNKIEWLAKANNQLGLLYLRTNKFNEAIEFFNEAIGNFTKLNNQPALASSINNLANCYFVKNDYQKSIEIRKQSIEIRKKLKQESGLGDSYNDLGDTYKELNQFDSAIHYLSKAYEIKQRIGDFEMCAVTTINLGLVYFELKDYSSALKYYELSNSYALKITSLPYRLEIWKRILKVYSIKNESQKQLDLLYKILALNDSVYNEENQKQINQLQLEFQTEKKELENKNLKIKNTNQIKLTSLESKSKNTIIIFSIIGGSVLILFLFIVYHRFRITRSQKNIIESQKLIVEIKQKEIIDSIQYAKRIQQSLLPSEKNIEKFMKGRRK